MLSRNQGYQKFHYHKSKLRITTMRCKKLKNVYHIKMQNHEQMNQLITTTLRLQK